MAYTANVLRMMIASPSDTIEARDAVESAAYGWNGANAQAKQTILHPWRWETSAVPMLGDHAQVLINSQGVDESDVVSGTVAEIERAIEQGKPVHLYFSTAPLPNDVDTAQLEGFVPSEPRSVSADSSASSATSANLNMKSGRPSSSTSRTSHSESQY